MVQIHPDPPVSDNANKRKRNVLPGYVEGRYQGAIAQLGERLPCTQEVGGSIPPSSTIYSGGCAKSHKQAFIMSACFWLFKSEITGRNLLIMLFNNLE